jgi:hypothetical protein
MGDLLKHSFTSKGTLKRGSVQKKMSNEFVTKESLQDKLAIADAKNELRFEKILSKFELGFQKNENNTEWIKTILNISVPTIIGMLVALFVMLIQMKSDTPTPISTASIQGQTLQGLQGSGVPGGYTGSKTHLHSPASTLQKHGDKSPESHASK